MDDYSPSLGLFFFHFDFTSCIKSPYVLRDNDIMPGSEGSSCSSEITLLLSFHLPCMRTNSGMGMWPAHGTTKMLGSFRELALFSKRASRDTFVVLWIITCRCAGWICSAPFIALRDVCLKVKMAQRGLDEMGCWLLNWECSSDAYLRTLQSPFEFVWVGVSTMCNEGYWKSWGKV